MQQPDRRVESHRLVVRALGHQRVEVVDDRQDARAERDLVGLEPGRVALAVPALVVAEDQGRDRVREGDVLDNLKADLRVNPDLLELLLGQAPGFRQDVLGDRELPDVSPGKEDGRHHERIGRESDAPAAAAACIKSTVP